MYKVFVNEKKLSISKSVTNAERNIRFEDSTSLEIAVDLLENTSCTEINVYGENLKTIWQEFTSLFKVIEAAGGMVYNAENKILFIYRLGKWDLPKGKLEPNELLKAAAIREIEEETGLKELILEYIGVDYLKNLEAQLEFVKSNYQINKPEKIQLERTTWIANRGSLRQSIRHKP